MISIVAGVGESIFGIIEIITSVAAGGATTVLSGGTLVLGGVSISVAGVTLGAAVVVDGVAVAVSAVASLGSDWDNFMLATGNGDGSGNEIKNVYDSIKKAPNYPEGFQGVQNGIKKVNVNNGPMLDELRKVEPGEWKKVYQNGYVNGKEASIHYFQHTRTGKVFDVKVKWKWSTGWN